MKQGKGIRELMRDYESALGESGFGYPSRLQQLQRIGRLAQMHERRGMESLNDGVVAEFFRDIDEEFYSGGCKKNNYQLLRRTAERFLLFAETSEIKMPNMLKGCREKINTEHDKIVEAFIATVPHPNTRNDARWVSNKYFAWLETQGFNDLTGAGAQQIRNYLLYVADMYSQNSMRDVRLYLSKLYEYLYEAGLTESDYHQLLSFKVNHEIKILPALSKANIAKMLETIDRRTVAGKRAYAVMMLGTVLGLRACDVAALQLADIDWVNGEIRILQSKTAKSLALPLTEDVGTALKDYILNGRPQSNSKYVFLRLIAPFDGLLTAVTMGEIYRDCCKAAGLPISKRFHNLRRSLGTSMVNAGISVYDVAQVLTGGENIESTRPYIAIDIEHLKLCALPFEGIAQKGGDAV